MSDQLQDIVSRMVAAGESEEDIALVIQQFSHQEPPLHPHARVGTWVKDNAPMIGGGIAAALTGGAGLIPSAIAAAGGGFLGARVRGDDRSSAATEGATQGVMEGAFGLGGKLLKAVAKPIYRAAIPKHIQDKFSQADLAGQGLDSRTWIGTKRGTESAAGAKATAGKQIDAASGSVPGFAASDVQAGFQATRDRAVRARKPGRVSDIDAHVTQSMSEMGSAPMSGADQLLRKEVLEGEGKSAMTAANSRLSPIDPQLANRERRLITANLRRSPTMAKALNTSQAAIGVERAAKATENSSVMNRLSHGGLWNAARTPAGLSGTAIGMNELANVPFAQLLRLAQMSQLKDEQ